MHELFLEEKYNNSKDARLIVETLEEAGYETYFVGGVVRDTILGIDNQDYDICTSASPNTILNIFKDTEFYCLDHSIKHNMVVVINNNNEQFEISTFKGNSIEDDLRVRDFTINAMAYSPRTGLIDPYNGFSDLNSSILRATDNPIDRFKEDPLRILRGIRFAARYMLTIEPKTKQCIHNIATSIYKEDFNEYREKIAQERIGKELIKLFESGCAANMLFEFQDVLFAIISETIQMYQYDQNNPHHVNDLLTHTLLVLYGIENNTMQFGPKRSALAFMFAALFHDIGKIETRSEKNGISHYFGHEKVSAEIAENIMKRIGVNKHVRKTTTTIIRLHDFPVEPQLSSVLRMLHKIDENYRGMAPEIFIDLCIFKLLDSASHLTSEEFKSAALNLDYLESLTNFSCKEIMNIYINSCMFDPIPYTVKMLPITGSDLILRTKRHAGPWVGKTLEVTLRHVMNGSIGCDAKSVLDEALKLSTNFRD